ncbi:MAG TPA: hypothetical protein VNA30_01530, partial [Mycobacteriales bacterium]|nr:hypothetical protein [Mycobacteriales bacterium]
MRALPRSPMRALVLAGSLGAAGLSAPAAAAAPVQPAPAMSTSADRALWRETTAPPLRQTLRGPGRANSLVSALPRASAGTPTQPRAQLQRSTWQVTYSGSFTTQQRAAFQSAVDTWSTLIESPVPITVSASFTSLPSGVLGQAGPGGFFVYDPDNQYDPSDTAYPVALANAVVEEDVDPSGPDILAEFNNTEPGVYYGTDGAPPPGMLDFPTIVLHELAHGLGMVGLADVDAAGRGTWDPGQAQPVPAIFDRFTTKSTSANPDQPVLSFPRGSTQLGQALTGGDLYWDGPLGKAGYNGKRPRLYTPTEWNAASSYSHLSDSDFPPGDPNALMTPFIQENEVVRDPGPITLGMFADMGYGVPRPLLPGNRYTPQDPVRLLDTRDGLGAEAAQVPAGGVIDLSVIGGSVPNGATAVVLNITATSPSAGTDVRVYPTPRSGTGYPVVSNLNVRVGETRANLVTVPVGHGGRVRLRNAAGRVHLLADLAGWYAPAASSTYVPVSPVRILSTRDTIGAPQGQIGPGGTLDLTVIGGPRAVPPTASAVVLGVTAFSA